MKHGDAVQVFEILLHGIPASWRDGYTYLRSGAMPEGASPFMAASAAATVIVRHDATGHEVRFHKSDVRPALTPHEVETLRALCDASARCGSLDGCLNLMHAYRALPQDDIRSLVSRGLWYQLSATQGNLTQRGADALSK